jgi:type VI secretion system protein ImpM
MHCALFGKLPAKRDFVAVNMPRDLLRFWEVWLQGALAGSMHALGPGWRDAYLAAPIWRFWLGREHVGSEVMGAFMPSLDGVGRYFPLAVLAQAPEGQAFAPPTGDLQGAWFDRAEHFLLDTLEPEAAYDETLAALGNLPAPEMVARDAQADPQAGGGLTGVADETGDGDIATLMERLDRADALVRQASGSYWWTIGGESFPALALRARTLPEAQNFSLLLTGPPRPPPAPTPTPQAEDESDPAASIGAEP